MGVRFRDASLLRLSLTHSSYVNEHPQDAPASNERLEYLGDAFLGLVVARKLYLDHPDMSEGDSDGGTGVDRARRLSEPLCARSRPRRAPAAWTGRGADRRQDEAQQPSVRPRGGGGCTVPRSGPRGRREIRSARHQAVLGRRCRPAGDPRPQVASCRKRPKRGALASPNIERSLNGDRGTTANSRSRLPSRESPLHRAAGGARWKPSDRRPQRPSPCSPLRRPDGRMNRRRRRNRTHQGSDRRDSRPVWPWVFLAAVVAVILALARTVL